MDSFGSEQMNQPFDDQIDDSSAPLIEHLAELRRRLIWSVSAFVLCFALSFTIWNPIYNFLTSPLCSELLARGQECKLNLLAVEEGLFVALYVAFVGGLAISFPIISYQMWRFIAPGLYRSEKNAFLPFLLASPLMFLLGAAFAFYIVIPFAFKLFLSFQQPVQLSGSDIVSAGISFAGSVKNYFALTIRFLVAFGLCFQLPVLLTLMGRAGLITADTLARQRAYAVVAILILAAIVTPPDVITQIILFSAIYGLYEISILLVRRIDKQREAEIAAEEEALFDEEDQMMKQASEESDQSK